MTHDYNKKCFPRLIHFPRFQKYKRGKFQFISFGGSISMIFPIDAPAWILKWITFEHPITSEFANYCGSKLINSESCRTSPIAPSS